MSPERPAKMVSGSADVERYIADLPGDARNRLNEMRKLINAAAPGATELISYGIPAVKYKKVVVYYGAWKSHSGMYGIGQKVLTPFKKEIGDRLTEKGTMKFPYNEPLPIDLVIRLIKAQVAEMNP